MTNVLIIHHLNALRLHRNVNALSAVVQATFVLNVFDVVILLTTISRHTHKALNTLRVRETNVGRGSGEPRPNFFKATNFYAPVQGTEILSRFVQEIFKSR